MTKQEWIDDYLETYFRKPYNTDAIAEAEYFWKHRKQRVKILSNAALQLLQLDRRFPRMK